jgi:hypothetical protein
MLNRSAGVVPRTSARWHSMRWGVASAVGSDDTGDLLLKVRAIAEGDR